jgi:hypothetical protein
MKTLIEQWRSDLMMADRPDEYEVKCLLGKLGLQVPRGIRLAPGSTAIIPDFPGPFAAKVCSPAILHKTDLRGVFLNLEPENLGAALRRLASAFPGAALLVEQMVTFEGPEMIAGGLIDPGFGPAVMVGTGGILTEIAQDTAFRLAPLEEAEARRMLMELKVYPVFEGFRGLSLDPTAMARLIVVVSRLVDALGARFDQLDLNPIVWSPMGWTILDAKLLLHAMP